MKSYLPKIIKKKDYYIFYYKSVNFKFFNYDFKAIDLIKILKLKSELEIFNFYLKYKNYYNSYADVGANVGAHSLFASRVFKKVYSYEPLIKHYNALKKNILLNSFNNIKTFNKAINISNKKSFLLELINNSTATHLTTAHRSVYGKTSVTRVRCTDISALNLKLDLIKLDVEGLEYKLLKKINFNLRFSDFLIEIHNYKNSREIFKKLWKYKKINLYKLKNLRLESIKSFKDMPISTTDGTLLITKFFYEKNN